MGTYNPAEFPRRPKSSTIFSEAHYQWRLAYYRYEINTGLYVMSAGEKTAFNLVLLSLLAFCFAAVYYCLPQAAINSLHRLAFYVTGTYRVPKPELVATLSLPYRFSQAYREAAASLGNGGTSPLNASNVLVP
ncbi:putative small subunit of serine palmitoyltransferase [Septoria linicola]|nr:putative small subunit of serine palmitoyltransferase [Septoria linicola]